jgi:hypothetical protein
VLQLILTVRTLSKLPPEGSKVGVETLFGSVLVGLESSSEQPNEMIITAASAIIVTFLKTGSSSFG